MLQPSMKDLLHASVISDAIGVGAKKKIAKQRINMLEGNVTHYSSVLNSPSQMERIKKGTGASLVYCWRDLWRKLQGKGSMMVDCKEG